MGFLSPKQSAPPLPPVPPPPPAPAVAEPATAVEDKVKQDKKRRKGKAETIVTGGAGLTLEPEISSPSLLGKKAK